MKKAVIGFVLTMLVACPISADAYSKRLKTFGDIAQIGVPIVAGLISICHKDYKGLFQLGEGAAYTAIATHGLKFAVNEKRPNGGSHSFPSGHSSAAAQGAAYLQFRYGWKYGLLAYAVAALVGYSRVDANCHYWRDVAVGMLIATAVQFVVTKMGYIFKRAKRLNSDRIQKIDTIEKL